MYIFIINPVAGKGRAKKMYLRLIEEKQFRKLNTICYETEYKGHAEQIIKKMNRTFQGTEIKALIIIGGDGTMHEVLNAFHNKQIPISFIACGSGNDFARGSSISKDANEVMANIIANKKQSSYWLGIYRMNSVKRKFVNCIGFGFDAVVARRANTSNFKKIFNLLGLGKVVYVITLIQSLAFYKPFAVTIQLDDVIKRFEHCFLLTINNQPYFGGGMKINPQAKNNQEHLSILVVDSISKWKVLALFATVYIGKHLYFKEVSTFTAKNIKVSADIPIPFQVDGETGETLTSTIEKDPIPIKITGSCNKDNGSMQSESINL